MTDDALLLVGSLSNDLFRVANLAQRGADKAAERFVVEAKKWAQPLVDENVADYIKKIANEVVENDEKVSMERAERYLMYGILLQNYALHQKG